MQVFCAHGGIPASVNRIETLNAIPVPLADPNNSVKGSKAAWEMLWNDPISRNEYKIYGDTKPLNNYFPVLAQGFLPNPKRGTAFLYSDDAIDNFFNLNGLAFVLRAHEVIGEGFTFHMNGKMMTIFSCSNYCGAGNTASVVYIQDSKMRVIKIETFKDFKEFAKP